MQAMNEVSRAWQNGGTMARAKLGAKRALVSSLAIACRPLEAGLGGLGPDGSGILTGTELTRELLMELFERRACAIRIPGFCGPELAASLSAWLLDSAGYENWAVRKQDGEFTPSDTFYSANTPFNVALKAEDAFRSYFTQALPAVRRLRAASRDLTPIDKLRLELEELWPRGARIDSYKGLKMSVGIGRVMTPAGMLDGIARTEGMCHVDGFSLANRRSGFFSANIYLRVPDSGGELMVWNVGVSPLRLACNLSLVRKLLDFDASSQAFIRSKLPRPLALKPEAGELVIIDSGRPHAVRAFEQGFRVTLQSFIRYRAGEPLALWT
jgi:hypothetical protein